MSTQEYREQIQLVVRAGLELGTSELRVQLSNRLATLPPITHSNPGLKLNRLWTTFAVNYPTCGIGHVYHERNNK